MSHFSVLVVSKPGEEVSDLLQPYHEYECTGIEDQYVIEVPIDEDERELMDEYEDYKDDYESFEDYIYQDHGYYRGSDGKLCRKTNPNRQWDWWVIGGRWSGMIETEHGRVDQCVKKDSKKIGFDGYSILKDKPFHLSSTFAVIKDGKWIEKGSMGWWGCVSDEKNGWDDEFVKIWESIPDDHILTVVDCHI